MSKYLKIISKELSFFLIAISLSYFVYALIPYFTMQLFEGRFALALWGYTICLALHVLFAYLGNILQVRWKVKYEGALKTDYFDAVTSLNFETFSKKKVGEYISFQANDIPTIVNDYLNPLVAIVTSVINIILTFGVISITLNFYVGFILAIFATVGVFLPKSLSKTTAKKRELYLEQQKKYYTAIEELFNGFKVINGRTKHSINNKHGEHLGKVLRQRYEFGKASSLMWALNGLGAESLNYAAFLYLGYLTFRGSITAGFAIATFQYAKGLSDPVHEILYSRSMIKSSKGLIEDYLRFTEKFSSATQQLQKRKINSYEKLHLFNVNKNYDNFRLSDINIEFERNKKYAFIGLNGSGKTTLFNILSRYIIQDSGDFKIDCDIIDSIDDNVIIGSMSQEEYIFSDSFHDNVTVYGSYEILDSNIFIEDAANFINCKNCSALSGGQKKILGLCRLMNKNTPIVLLDEPFAHVDENRKEVLFDKLVSLNKTVIVVTHDIGESLSKFDKVLFFDKGQLLYSATYDEIKKTKEFNNLKNAGKL